MPQAQFIHQGDAVDYTPTADVAAGYVVVQNKLVGVSKRDIKADELGALAIEGVFDITKESTDVIAAGNKLYWDAAGSKAVTDPTGNKLLGKAVADAGSGTSTVRTRLSQ